MKYIKTYKIFEFVKNSQLVNSYLDDIKKAVIQINPGVKIYKDVRSSSNGEIGSVQLVISCLKENDLSDLEKILTNWKKKLLKESIMLSFRRVYSCPVDSIIQYLVNVKDIFTERVNPNRFIFHFTNSDVNSILSKGLIPKESSESESWNNTSLEYIPAVFAINSFNPRYMWGGKNIILIDTEGLPNKWWYDLNFEDGSPAIMTFEPVSPKHIRLITHNEYSSICKMYNSNLSDDELNKQISSLLDNETLKNI